MGKIFDCGEVFLRFGMWCGEVEKQAIKILGRTKHKNSPQCICKLRHSNELGEE